MAKFWLEDDKVCSDEDLSVFDDEQMEQIRLGLESRVDVRIYAKPEFDDEQMEQIRIRLEKDRSQNVSEHVESTEGVSVKSKETTCMNSFNS